MHSSEKKTGRSAAPFLWVLVFLLIFAIVNEYLTLALNDDIDMRINISRASTQTCEDVILGTSQARLGIDPDTVSETTGRSTANLSIPYSNAMDQYFMIRQMVESGHRPERIVYEADPTYFERSKGGIHYYAFPMGKVRMEYWLACAKDNWRSALSPWIQQADLLPQSPDIFKRKIAYFRGDYDHSFNGFTPSNADLNDKNKEDREFQVNSKSDGWLKKLITYCRNENIDLVILLMPLGTKVYEQEQKTFYREASAYLAEVCEEYDITFWNFNEVPATQYDISGFIDSDGHMKEQTAESFSRVLGEYLSD